MAKRPFVVGLTGNIGSGKSTILTYFTQYDDVWIVDADRLAHKAMEPTGPAYQPIVEAFGPDVVGADGFIDRPSLGKVVFSNPDKLSTLEAITHPAVFQLAQDLIDEAGQAKVKLLILEAIKLLDGGPTVKLCDEIWVVTIDAQNQLDRLQEQRGMDADSVISRLKAQSSQNFKVTKADRVIDNSGSLADLRQQLDRIWSEFNKQSVL